MRLNTLGGIRVAVADGRLMTGAAAQPRRLAVLALLARAGRPGITREKTSRCSGRTSRKSEARRSLNQAVYSLRRDLGDEDALIGARDLQLNLDRIEVDTIEFDDAISSTLRLAPSRRRGGSTLGVRSGRSVQTGSRALTP